MGTYRYQLPVLILTLLSLAASDSMSAYQIPSKFHNLRQSWVTLSCRFFKIAATASQFYSRFEFGNILHFRRSKSISRSYLEKISQSIAEILLLPVSEHKRLSYWNFTSDFDFGLTVVSGIILASANQILSKSDHHSRVTS